MYTKFINIRYMPVLKHSVFIIEVSWNVFSNTCKNI